MPDANDLRDIAPEPEENTKNLDILASYARYAEIREARREGLTILMPLLYEDGNLNRERKRSRVKAEPSIGKYEIFSRDIGTAPYKTNYLYCMSASGYLVQLGETERLKDLTEQRLDQYILEAQTKLDIQLADPTKWADFAAAALLNQIDEAQAHNVPVRELREAERRTERESQQESDRRLATEKEQILNARIDEIAKAIETGSKIQVAYDAGTHRGKNPVLELFKLYGVNIPLRTQGWVNSRLAAISGDSYSYYRQNGGKPSTTFMNCLHKLTAAVKRTPIERKRGLPNTEQTAKNTEVNNTLEHQLYEKFAEMFPDFMSGKYDTMRLEAENAKPLELEWVFGDTVSIAHIYEFNGEPAYEPRVMLKVNGEEKTMSAASLELSEPPRIDNVYDDRGCVNAESQRNINSFTIQWLDRAAKQRFKPVEATYDIDEHGNISKAGLITDTAIRVTFDADGKAVLPEPKSVENRTEAERAQNSTEEERTADSVYAKYRDTVAERAAAYAVSSGTVLHEDEAVARKSCEQIVKRVVNDMLLEAGEHYPLYRQFTNNAEFKARLEDYAYAKAYLENSVRAVSNHSFPDQTVTPGECEAYGYTAPEMRPLKQEKALELFDAGQTIYLLYSDNTEGMAFERDEIINHDGLYGIEHADWQHSDAFKQLAILSDFREETLESDLLLGGESKFGIYQIPDYIENYRDFRFAPIRELEAHGLAPDRNNYKLVYTAPLNQVFFNGLIPDHNRTLEALFANFQDNRPADFTQRSVSVSDVIVLQHSGEVSAYFVDSFGFKELPSFTGNEREKIPEQTPEISADSPPRAERTTLSQIETRPEPLRNIESQKMANKATQTLLAELSEAKDALSISSQPNAHKTNHREV
jgi:hypothetical protein